MKKKQQTLPTYVWELIAVLVAVPFIILIGEQLYQYLPQGPQPRNIVQHDTPLPPAFNYAASFSYFRKTDRLKQRYANDFKRFVMNGNNKISLSDLIANLHQQQKLFDRHFHEIRRTHKRSALPRTLRNRLFHFRKMLAKKLHIARSMRDRLARLDRLEINNR